ncbi:hypothetical protein BB546_11355 [Escherichia coli]|nr:hypothetical protein BB546_11355 [Escherichia coli]
MVISHKSAQNHTKSPYPAPHKACRFYQAARTPPRIDHYPTCVGQIPHGTLGALIHASIDGMVSDVTENAITLVRG